MLAWFWPSRTACPGCTNWASLDSEATRAAADFLSWLEAELGEQRALWPLWDSRVLEEIKADVAAIREALEANWREALAEARSVHIGGSVSRAAVVAGDYNIIIQYFTQPIQRLPIDYAARIRNFMTAYLGTPGNPVPFGGRADPLAWLETKFGSRLAAASFARWPNGSARSAPTSRIHHSLYRRCMIFLLPTFVGALPSIPLPQDAREFPDGWTRTSGHPQVSLSALR